MRRADWLPRLWETIAAHAALPFRWGGTGDAHDCCTFPAECVDAMTGSAHLGELLTHYHDEPTALAYIESAGGFEPLISQYLGPTKRVTFMQRGDVVLVEHEGRTHAGVCIGQQIAAAAGQGLVRIDRKHAIACWGV